jgi:transposase
LASERDRPDVQQRRRDYLSAIETAAAARLVFVDETGTHVEMTRLYSRSLVGQRAYGKVSRRHRVNLTVIGAIALDGVRALMAHEGGTTREAFLHFVTHALVPSLKKGDIVVMDNLRAHHFVGVQKTIEAAGCHVLYLPPYSPELNPIELTWSKVKALLRKIGARTLSTLAASLPFCRQQISPSDLRGWFEHCGCFAQPNG